MLPIKAITVVDARMGRGKSSAAIHYMNQYQKEKRFLYVTPYLKEVDRVCELCDFDQPGSDFTCKSIVLKEYLRRGDNVAATHALFYLMDEEAVALVREQRYTLIIDESIDVVRRFHISASDMDVLFQLVQEDELGALSWKDPEYSGVFRDYKVAADFGSLFRLDGALLHILNPRLLRAADEVFMLTYMFNGQYQRAYLDFFEFKYRVVGVEQCGENYYFSDRPDEPPPIDYSHLLNVVDNPKMNEVGDSQFALSKAWFQKRGRNNVEMKKLRNGMRNFYDHLTQSDKDSRLWTCFKSDVSKLVGERGRYRNDFLQTAARATNEYRHKTDIAYMVNRFADPNIIKLFASHGISIDQDDFALSEMLQWIWRSAIRDGRPINLYVPSRRMRKLLIGWIEKMNQGGAFIDEKKSECIPA